MRNGLASRAGELVAILTSMVLAAGCYHAIITTDLPPSTEVYRESFKPAFIAGLVPAQLDASKYCPGRRWARVETQYSFLDWVVGAVTLGIFTPMDIRITCAAAGAMRMPDGPTLQVGDAATDAQRNETMAAAMEIARTTGEAVYVLGG